MSFSNSYSRVEMAYSQARQDLAKPRKLLLTGELSSALYIPNDNRGKLSTNQSANLIFWELVANLFHFTWNSNHRLFTSFFLFFFSFFFFSFFLFFFFFFLVFFFCNCLSFPDALWNLQTKLLHFLLPFSKFNASEKAERVWKGGSWALASHPCTPLASHRRYQPKIRHNIKYNNYV